MVEEFEESETSTPTIDVPVEYQQDCHYEEPTPREEYLGSFEEDSLSEEENQDLIIEVESQEEVFDSPSVEPLSNIEDQMWPLTLPPIRASLYHTFQAHPLKPSYLENTYKEFSHHAKLEGIHNRDLYVVFYDI